MRRLIRAVRRAAHAQMQRQWPGSRGSWSSAVRRRSKRCTASLARAGEPQCACTVPGGCWLQHHYIWSAPAPKLVSVHKRASWASLRGLHAALASGWCGWCLCSCSPGIDGHDACQCSGVGQHASALPKRGTSGGTLAMPLRSLSCSSSTRHCAAGPLCAMALTCCSARMWDCCASGRWAYIGARAAMGEHRARNGRRQQSSQAPGAQPVGSPWQQSARLPCLPSASEHQSGMDAHGQHAPGPAGMHRAESRAAGGTPVPPWHSAHGLNPKPSSCSRLAANTARHWRRQP